MQVKTKSSDKDYSLTLEGGGKIRYIADFLDEDEIDQLYEHLTKDIDWVQGEYSIFGKSIKTPRLLWAMVNELKIYCISFI